MQRNSLVRELFTRSTAARRPLVRATSLPEAPTYAVRWECSDTRPTCAAGSCAAPVEVVGTCCARHL
jgi:hypothetical protein